VADAVEHGAKVLTGGKRMGKQGFFYMPTVLGDVPMEARVMQEEPFGPIAVLRRFDTLEDGLAEANRLPYGLSAYAFTTSAQTAIAVGDGLEAGMIGINQLLTPRRAGTGSREPSARHGGSTRQQLS
jgi:succinate-semialdehyde dehydrogenase/glutarate-semialdehyde dehydrogenase